MLSNRLSLILTTAIAPALWGTTYLVTTELLPPQRPLLAAFIRALPAGLLLVALTRRLPQGVWWWRALVLGALNIGAFNALLFIGAYRLPGGVAATVGALQPLLVALLSTGLLGERLTTKTLLTATAGVAGVSLLVLRADARLDAWGVVAALGGAVVMATGVVLSKRWASPAPLLATTGWQLVAGGLLLLPVAWLVEGSLPSTLTLANLAGYSYLTIFGSAVAYALWFRGLRALSPTDVTFLGLLSPVVATTLGWLVLNQQLTALQLTGSLIVLAALITAQLKKKGLTMRITIFGATGAVGRRAVAEAVARGHEVTAVGRGEERLRELVLSTSDPAGRLRTQRGDASDPGDVVRLSQRQDVVISATRPVPGQEGELAIAAKGLTAGLAGTGIRLLIVGGAASLTLPGDPSTTVVDGPGFPAELRPIALACNEQLDVVRGSTEVDWTYLSPPALLEPGTRTGSYRVGRDELLVSADGTSYISMEDFAVALIDEAERGLHHGIRFTVGY